jgi:xylulokinase
MGELTPVFDPNARGAFVGLSAKHTAAELARAVMEGVAYSVYNDFCAFRESGVRIESAVMCGGGANSALWRQIFADLLAVPIRRMRSSECAVLGAAILAGCASELYPSVAEGCRRVVRFGDTVEPDLAAHAEYLKMYGVFAGLHGALRETFADLKRI